MNLKLTTIHEARINSPITPELENVAFTEGTALGLEITSHSSFLIAHGENPVNVVLWAERIQNHAH